ncbi:MAG: HigA family addiction module antitoxin [Hyphomicrobiaceae bacterium]
MTMELERGWSPNWAVHPGEYLEENLDVRGWSQAEFARLSGLTKKHVSDMINGKNPVTPETALKLQRVLGVNAQIWIGMQADWDFHEARVAAQDLDDQARAWVARQPVRELKKCRIIQRLADDFDVYNDLLTFYRIGTFTAYDARVKRCCVHHRQAGGRGEVLPEYVFAWLMMGEWQARTMNLPEYDRKIFRKAVDEIRALTSERPSVFVPEMKRLCGNAGVALIFEPAFPKTKLFGSARWIDGRRPVIQMSLRMKANDHFWWTFFHECGHILLHEGRDFADDKPGEPDAVEAEANAFATEILVGRKRLEQIVSIAPKSKSKVRLLAEELGIHPGILVGMLQHHEVIEFRHMNDLKVKIEFKKP